MRRSKHNLSHYRLHTAKMGQLFPIGCVPVLPGDTIQHSTSMLVRAAPLNTPVMHPTQIRIHHWYVPNRIIWDEWEDFITKGPIGQFTNPIPTIPAPLDNGKASTYLGIPFVEGGVNAGTFNALPLRAYNLIFNEFYRDQDLVTGRLEDDDSLALCAWEKDFFTTARPWTQKGPAVTLPIGDSAPVITSGQSPNFVGQTTGNALGQLQVDPAVGDSNDLQHAQSATQQELVRFGAVTGLTADLTNATGLDVNEFRQAFALQRYQEARARYGSRFTEYLQYLGIRPSDARLQRPEYLGGGVQRLQYSEVLQTAPSAADDNLGVGDLYGHGIAGVKTPRYRKFFEEHGYVITLCSVRPKSMYLNATPREFVKKTTEDYYQKELVHLGQQEITDEEINPDATVPTNVFGYQDRYDEYRYHPSQVGQEFKKELLSWHMGRDIPADQALSGDFVKCDPSRRIFQVTSQDGLWCMANHRIVARRLVPKRAYPRIL